MDERPEIAGNADLGGEMKVPELQFSDNVIKAVKS